VVRASYSVDCVDLTRFSFVIFLLDLAIDAGFLCFVLVLLCYHNL
jgi:hypothetical protein